MKRILFPLLLTLCYGTGIAQDETRRIWPEEYIKPQGVQKRPAAPRPKPSYKVSTPQIKIETVAEDTVIGITLWRLESASAETGETAIVVEKGGQTEHLIPKRVESNTQLSRGDRVRLSVEAARDGYLYVINREQYQDGSFGDPYLIFPTRRILQGDNRTARGRVIELPAQSDNPPYFTLTPGRADQIAEVISVFVTPAPLTNLNISNQPAPLPREQVGEWEKQWGKSIGRLELAEGAGKAWTQTEKEAGVGSRLLRHEDPSPQTIYYNPDVKAGDPAFISVDLRYASVKPQ